MKTKNRERDMNNCTKPPEFFVYLENYNIYLKLTLSLKSKKDKLNSILFLLFLNFKFLATSCMCVVYVE